MKIMSKRTLDDSCPVEAVLSGQQQSQRKSICSIKRTTVPTSTKNKRRNSVVAFQEKSLENLPQKPAYERFSHLTAKNSEVNHEIDTLPSRYRRILTIFQALETLISFHKVRGSGSHLVFENIRDALEHAASASVSVKDIAHVVAIDPQMFQVNQAKVINQKTTATFRIDWDITVENTSGIQKLIEERRKRFLGKLIDVCKRQHEEYVLNHGFDQMEAGKIYHTGFMVAKSPELPTYLPILEFTEAPDVTVTKAKITDSLKIIRRNDDTTKSPNPIIQSGCDNSPSLSLLERIKLKEKRKKEYLEANRKQSSVKELAQLSRLPMLASNIDGVFKSCNKTAMYSQKLARMLVNSWKTPISEDEIFQATCLISKIVPEWLAIETNEYGSVVTIQFQTERSKIIKIIQEYVDKQRAPLIPSE